jgi:O-succinylbenzoic acid--CoA ligase
VADIRDLFEFPTGWGDTEVLRESDSRVTFESLRRVVAVVAHDLLDLGVEPGDRVAIAEPNRFECPLVLLALWRLGAVACLLNIRQPAAVLNAQCERIGCRYQVMLPGSKVASPAIAPLVISPSLTAEAVDIAAPTPTASAPATIIFTSGTAHEPKAVLHTLGNHYYNALGSNANIPVRPGDRWLCSLPLYHVGGLAILFRCLLGGGTVHMAAPGADLYSLCRQHRLTHVSLVATQLRRLLEAGASRQALPDLTCLLLGGGPTPESLTAAALDRGLPVFRSYGLTEMASQVATSSRPDGSRRRVLDYREIRLAPDGEILVRGKTRFSGYVNGADLETPFDPEGWFATGDIGAFDSESGLRIIGRKDNMFIAGGENVQPEQIETALRSLPGVCEAVVVPAPDSEFGARPVAFVAAESFTPQAWRHALSRSLPGYMIPVAFYSWPEFAPQSGIKADRRFFRTQAEHLRR